MNRVVERAGAAILLAAPTAIAFFSGGYFDQPRLIAAIVAWVGVVIIALAACDPLPRRAPGRVGLGGLALLAAIVGLSITWAPLKGPALADFERLLLYVAFLTGAIALLRGRDVLRVVEPALAGGVLIVVAEGLSERVLPGLFTLSHGLSAGGRLEQPLTYWNAMGVLAARGFVLALRVAGDERRARGVRAAYAAVAVPLATGLYLSFSRGALAAAAAGVLSLAFLMPARPQLRSLAVGIGASVPPVLVAASLAGVRTLEGGLGTREREREGAALLAALLLSAAAAAAAQWVLASREHAGRLDIRRFELPARRLVYLVVVAVLAIGGAVAAASYREKQTRPAFGATSKRLGSLETNRYAYWKVAGREFLDHPLRGGGSGSFRTEWLEHRKIPDPTTDAHSIYIETAAELGLIGLAALGLFLGGVAASAVSARAADPRLAAGLIAGTIVWLVHAGLDWDWEMPAVSLVALALMGALLATADARPES